MATLLRVVANVLALLVLSVAHAGQAPSQAITVEELAKQLSEADQTVRDIAAERLHTLFKPSSRQDWEAKLAALEPGLTVDQALAKLGLDDAKPASILPDDIARDFRLDETWVARLWLDRRNTRLTKAEPVQQLRWAWVNPPEKFTGRWVTYYINGQKRHQIDYRDGKYHGEFISFHPNGEKSVVQHYDAVLGVDGEDTGYYPSGKVEYRARYKAGEKVGTWIWFEEDGKERSREKHTDNAPVAEAKPPKAGRSLDIIITQRIVLWDGKIMPWEDVVAELRRIRKEQGKPIHPHFYFTNGAHGVGRWDEYKARVMESYRELFEPAGVSLGSISPRAGERYDAIREPKDLIPDPKTIRTGIAVIRGKPVAGALVVATPEDAVMPIVLKPDLTLRDPLDEVWTTTDETGAFTLPVPEKGQQLSILCKEGYVLAPLPKFGEKPMLILEPLAAVEVSPLGGEAQQLTLRFHPAGLPETSPGFTTYEVALDRKPVTLLSPAGKFVLNRSFALKDGGSRSYPAETLTLKSGGKQTVHLPATSEGEADAEFFKKPR